MLANWENGQPLTLITFKDTVQLTFLVCMISTLMENLGTLQVASKLASRNYESRQPSVAREIVTSENEVVTSVDDQGQTKAEQSEGRTFGFIAGKLLQILLSEIEPASLFTF